MSIDLSNPHDKFFKEVFSRPEVASDFLQNYLPKEIAKLIDPQTITTSKDSFTDQYLQEHFSDLLFEVQLKDKNILCEDIYQCEGKASVPACQKTQARTPALPMNSIYVYILFEHKSFPEPMMAFHLLRYMVRIWEKDLKESKSGGLRLIIPIVVYHEEQTWKISRRFEDLFPDIQEIKPYSPDFKYLFYNLGEYKDDDIQGELFLRIALLLMKHIYSRELKYKLREIFELLRKLGEAKNIGEIVETVVIYILSGTEKISYEDLNTSFQYSFDRTGKNIMPTIAEQLIQKGEQQGLYKGKIETSREHIIDIISTRFGEIPSYIIDNVHQIENITLLDQLHKQSVLVNSIEEFQEKLSILLHKSEDA